MPRNIFRNLTRRVLFSSFEEEYSQITHNLGITETLIIRGEPCEIDRRFVPSITLLNQKGYPTLFCCSGHTKEEEYAIAKMMHIPIRETCGSVPYISFPEMILETVPKNFYVRTSYGKTGIYNSYARTFYDSHKFGTFLPEETLIEIANDVLDWTNSLPVRS